MAIVKRGNDMPVVSYYGNDGDAMMCPKCGNKLVVIAIDANDNNLICDICDLDDE
ncbi:hypothetical protein LCGC14_1444320 [marine sediment metagenome]|uniref:Uncharacterized protein n=1 Tax=marine sediment metagenome TaxID=412755 RepID=A0A0F9M073_9ZZZZ